MIVKWRGHETKAFYIDEIRVDIEQLLGVNTADIAMLKVYPPPFFGSSQWRWWRHCTLHEKGRLWHARQQNQ